MAGLGKFVPPFRLGDFFPFGQAVFAARFKTVLVPLVPAVFGILVPQVLLAAVEFGGFSVEFGTARPQFFFPFPELSLDIVPIPVDLRTRLIGNPRRPAAERFDRRGGPVPLEAFHRKRMQFVGMLVWVTHGIPETLFRSSPVFP